MSTPTISPEAAVDELTYRSYAYNRDRSPEIPADRWRRVYADWAAAFELRYQQERWGSVT